MDNIEILIKKEKLESITENYSIEELLKSLSFKKAMGVSKILLENDQFDFDIQEYAVHLIEKIKQAYPNEWDENWRHEAYLGYAYSILGCDIEKEFDAYSTAAKKSTSPPLEVLMHMALLWSYPGVYKIKMDEETAIKILEEIARTTPYMEALGGLIRLYEETKQIDKVMYWREILKKSEKENIYDRHSYLDFFKEY